MHLINAGCAIAFVIGVPKVPALWQLRGQIAACMRATFRIPTSSAQVLGHADELGSII
jgi:hypothetical protein